jgi:hypothetical protein
MKQSKRWSLVHRSGKGVRDARKCEQRVTTGQAAVKVDAMYGSRSGLTRQVVRAAGQGMMCEEGGDEKLLHSGNAESQETCCNNKEIRSSILHGP